MPPKQIHLIRHAEGFHNLCVENHAIRDPLLTPEGERQCMELSKKFEDALPVDCIVASPLRRALYTALITFRDVFKNKPELRIIALPELQETASIQADVGLSREELQLEFQQHPVDFSLVSYDWNNKTSGSFAPRTDLIARRGRMARKFLQGRVEHVVAVVTHGAFLHFLTEDWADSMIGDGTGWANCELRTYEFDARSPDTVANATMTETNTSFTHRNHVPYRLTPDQQLQCRAVAQKSWAAVGYITLADDTITTEVATEDTPN